MSTSRPFSVATILAAMAQPPAPPSADRWVDQGEIIGLILALHRSNREQWEREDDVRRHNSDDAMVATAKRDIDLLNSARHRLIEAIDLAMADAISQCEEAPLVTESPGMAIDRLSVLVLRLASTETRAALGSADADTYGARLPVLRHQLDQLAEAITTLINDLTNGERRFLAHVGLKLYGPE